MRVSVQYKSESYAIMPGQSLKIGRSIESDLRLFEDTAVSRDHCTVRFLDHALIVEDSGSTSGTRVNGRTIDAPTELRNGDSVGVGLTDVTVRIDAGGDQMPHHRRHDQPSDNARGLGSNGHHHVVRKDSQNPTVVGRAIAANSGP